MQKVINRHARSLPGIYSAARAPRHLVAGLAVASVLLCADASSAATRSGNLLVRAAVEEVCYVSAGVTGSAGTAVMDFGTLATLTNGADADTSGAGSAPLRVLCTQDTPYLLSVDSGTHSHSGQRYMQSAAGGDTLPYNLYTDSGRTVVPRSNGVIAVGVGSGTVQSWPLYGRIPAGTPLPEAGQYTDTVTLTVSW